MEIINFNENTQLLDEYGISFTEMCYPVGLNIVRNLPLINLMANAIAKKKGNKHSLFLYCKGSSGSIIAAIISQLLSTEYSEIKICHIKKAGEHSHSSHVPTPLELTTQVVIVDDFVASGATVNEILRDVMKLAPDIDKPFIEIYVTGGFRISRILDIYHKHLKTVFAAVVNVDLFEDDIKF